MNKVKAVFVGLLILWLPLSSVAQQLSREQIKGLDEQVQEIKKDVLAISTELNQLEEKLLYPSNTQVSIFVSVAKGTKYSPDAIQLKLDAKKVAYHIYSFKEVDALQRGGVQRIYTGNLRQGSHQLEVSLIGKHSGNNKNKIQSSFSFSKGVGPKLVEISLGAGGSVVEVIEQ